MGEAPPTPKEKPTRQLERLDCRIVSNLPFGLEITHQGLLLLSVYRLELVGPSSCLISCPLEALMAIRIHYSHGRVQLDHRHAFRQDVSLSR